jgi:hypothetical protein
MSDNENPFDKIPPVDETELVTRIGERLKVRVPKATEEGEPIQVGAIYEVVDRFAYAWQLRLVQGDGAKEVRVLNSTIDSFFDH